jgi:hypothetical protein
MNLDVGRALPAECHNQREEAIGGRCPPYIFGATKQDQQTIAKRSEIAAIFISPPQPPNPPPEYREREKDTNAIALPESVDIFIFCGKNTSQLVS